MKQLTFIVLVLIVGICFSKKKTARPNLLFLLSFYFVFNLGFIFYRFTGIMACDFPVFALIALGTMSKGKFRFSYPGISAPVFCIIIWSLITASLSIKFGWAMAELSMIIRGYLVFICVANHLKTKKDLDYLINGFFVGIAFQFFMAVYQWRIGVTPLMPFINEQFHEWRATGSFYMPHYLANYLLMLLPLVFRLLLYYKPPKKNLTIQYGVLFGFGLVTFLITFARGAWISFAGAVTLMGLFSLVSSKYRLKVKWAMGLMMVAACFFAIKYSPTIIRQFGAERNDAATIRLDQFRTAKRLIKDNLVFGTGLGNYELVSPNYVYDYEKVDPRSWQFSEMVHNSYLFFTAQLGIPGILMFFWGVILVFKKGNKLLKSTIPYFFNLGIGILTALIGLGVAFLAGPDIKSMQLLVHMGIYIGILVGLPEQERMIKRRIYFLKKKQEEERKKKGNNPPEQIAFN